MTNNSSPINSDSKIQSSKQFELWRIVLYSLIVILGLYSGSFFSQSTKVDSLIKALTTEKMDTNTVNALNALAIEYRNNDPDTAISLATKAGIISEKIKYQKGMADAELLVGTAITNKGQNLEALLHLRKALIHSKEKRTMARIHNNIAIVYRNMNNYPEALKENFLALRIREEIKDKNGIAITHNNIGNIYFDQENYKDALKEYSVSLALREELADKKGLGDSHNNIGNIYKRLYRYSEALREYNSALKLREELHDKQGMAHTHNNIGNIYWDQEKYSKALTEYFAALELFKQIKSNEGIAVCHNNIGGIYVAQKEFSRGKDEINLGMDLAKQIRNKLRISESYEALMKTDSALKDYKGALANYKMYISYRDSLVNEENIKKQTQVEMNYEFDKKEAAVKAEQERKDAVTNIIIYSISGGFCMVLLLAGLIFRWYRQKQQINIVITQQKKEVEMQKQLVEEKQKDILDSIYYAKRIQQSMIPTEKYIDKQLRMLKK